MFCLECILNIKNYPTIYYLPDNYKQLKRRDCKHEYNRVHNTTRSDCEGVSRHVIAKKSQFCRKWPFLEHSNFEQIHFKIEIAFW